MSDHRPRMKPKFASRSIRMGVLKPETPVGTQKVWGGTEVFQSLPYQGYPSPATDFVPGAGRYYDSFSPTYVTGKVFIECVRQSNSQLRETILGADIQRFTDLGGLVFSWSPSASSTGSVDFWNRSSTPIGTIEILKDIRNFDTPISELSVPDADQNGTPQGRYWAETWEDRWGDYTNTTTLHRFQFSCSIGLSSATNVLAPRVGFRSSGYRKRMAWFDLANGIKLLSMEAATKFILHTTVNLWERNRQWERFPSTGIPHVLREGESATQYLADYNWGPNLPAGAVFPTWVDGAFPPSAQKTFLDSFKAAFVDNDTATMTTLATQALQRSVALGPVEAFPTQSRYHLHRMRFPCPQPTYEGSPPRDIGLTWMQLPRRIEHRPPDTWTLINTIDKIHTQSSPEDRVVTYPNAGNESLVERDFQSPSLVYDVAIRGVRANEGQGLGTEQEIGTGFPHPTVPVEAFSQTLRTARDEYRTYSRTAAPAMLVDPLPNVVRWIQEGSTRVIPTSILPLSGTGTYEPVSYRSRLNKILGSTGMVSGTSPIDQIHLGLPDTGPYYLNPRYVPSGLVVEGWIGGQQKPTAPDRSFTLLPGQHFIPYAPFEFPISPTIINPFLYRKMRSTSGSSPLPEGLVELFFDRPQQRFILFIRQGWSGSFDFQYKIPGFYAISEPITITVSIPEV